jgi:hypothetical protein
VVVGVVMMAVGVVAQSAAGSAAMAADPVSTTSAVHSGGSTSTTGAPARTSGTPSEVSRPPGATLTVTPSRTDTGASATVTGTGCFLDGEPGVGASSNGWPVSADNPILAAAAGADGRWTVSFAADPGASRQVSATCRSAAHPSVYFTYLPAVLRFDDEALDYGPPPDGVTPTTRPAAPAVKPVRAVPTYTG